MQDQTKGHSMVYQLLVCMSVICCSCGLIMFNKFLMHEGRFPYAPVLCSFHMITSFLFALVMLVVKPEVFTGLKAVTEAPEGILRTVVTRFAPIGIFFTGNLILSNHAYLFCSVSFLQMMKEMNIGLVFIAGAVIGIEKFEFRRGCILMFIMVAAAAAAAGDIRLSVVGVSIQLASQVFEVCKIMTQSCLLKGDKKVDPFSLLLFMCPVCLVFLSVVAYSTWTPEIPKHAMALWPYLLANCGVALLLNLANFFLLEAVAASSYTLVGVVKDIVAVALSAAIFQAPVTAAQGLCFSLALAGIWVHAMYRSFPEAFEDSFFRGVLATVPLVQRPAGLKGKPEETAPLIARKAQV